MDWCKIAEGILPVGIAALGNYLDKGSPDKVGYQGGIPQYTAHRQQVPYPNDPNRVPGSGGRRYFSDVVYSGDPSTGAATAEQAAQITGQQVQDILANQTPTMGGYSGPTGNAAVPASNTGGMPPWWDEFVGMLQRGGSGGSTGGGASGGSGSNGGAAWQRELDAIHGAAAANYQPGRTQQNRINDLVSAFNTNIGSKPLSDLTMTQLRLAARSILNAQQEGLRREDFSREELETMGRAMGDANAYTTHPLAQHSWETSLYRGTLPLRNVGRTPAGYATSDMSREELEQLIRAFMSKYGTNNYANGGIASVKPQGYYLGGSTDGMADGIAAMVDNKRPAALSDGEFVIPADVVSHLGNGNSNAGAKELYDMMERVRKMRTGNPEQGRRIDPKKTMPV